MNERNLNDLKKTSMKLTEDIKNEAKDLYNSFKTRRSRIKISRQITLDPFSFFIGGVGCVAIGQLTDDGRPDASSDDGVISSALRILAYPVRTAVRFFAGGCIYTVIDSMVAYIMEHRAPYISGAISGVIFAIGNTHTGFKNMCRPSLFAGVVLGMGLFAQTADFMFDIYLTSR